MSEKADPELHALYIPFYFDEDVSLAIVRNLQQRGFDALSSHAAHMLRQNDEQQLWFAVEQRRTLVTHNRADFEYLHNQWQEANRQHFGIVIAKRRAKDEMVVIKLLELLNELTAEEMRNQLRYV